MTWRTLLFWCHLACGVVAGGVILIMSVTGLALTYQRQITAWADTRGYHVQPAARRVSADALVAAAIESRPGVTPTSIVIRREASAPASLTLGPGRQLFVDPYTAAVLGEGNGEGVRAFFRSMVEWHRYLATSGTSRPAGKAITGAANLIFLFIVVSGFFLWWPRWLRWPAIRSAIWFRGGLRGRARDFNWHNAIGFWSAIPLAIIITGGVVISYPWATGLVYRAYGEAPPAPAGGAARGAAPSPRRPPPASSDAVSLDAVIAKAERQMPAWRSLSLALPAPDAPRVVVTVDAGDGGQPQKRATLTLDRRTGEVLRWEPFASQSPGRRSRMWLRFAHTGEVYGLIGQTVAGLVTGGAIVLVWTGLALALRRLFTWRKRSREAIPRAA